LRLSDSKFGFILSLPGIIFLFAVVIFPLVFMIAVAFLRWDNVNPVVFNGFENFKFIISDRVFWLSLRLAFVFCAGSTLVTFLFGLILALCLSRISRGSYLFGVLAILPWAVPLVVSGFIWGWMFDPEVGVISYILMKLGLINRPLNIYANPDLAMFGVILADAWTRIPLMTVFLHAGFRSVPSDLYDAAKVDGAGPVGRFIHITLPISKSYALTGLFITSIFSFRTIDAIVSMTRGGPAKATYVLGYYIFDKVFKGINFGVASAASVIMFVLLITFGIIYMYFIFIRR